MRREMRQDMKAFQRQGDGCFECGFSFMKSSLASSQSICASIAAANCGMALSREKLRISRLIF
jgi:hypothetical protein